MSPYDLIDGPNDSVVVFADHASNHIPEWVGDLGVEESDLQRHIAWDIGSETVARTLRETLNCPAIICGFSRLVIDANRDPDAEGLIPITSDDIDIPGNVGLSPVERDVRIERLYRPYHAAIGRALDLRPNALVLSIHSFTPQLSGEARRKTDIGLLVKDDTHTPISFIAQMTALAPDLQVDVNEPYSAYDLNHTIDHNVVPRGHRHLAIELRQDHIIEYDKARRMAHILTRAIDPILKETNNARHSV